MKILNSAWPMAVALLLFSVAWSQEQLAAPARPQFEVASLKPSNGCENASQSREPEPFSQPVGDAVRHSTEASREAACETMVTTP